MSSVDLTGELKTNLSRALWRSWTYYCAAIGVLFILIEPLFSFTNVPNLVQTWLDSLLPTLVTVGLATLLFGLWSLGALWFIDRLILQRYPVDLPVARLRPRLGLACLGIALFGCMAAAGLGALAHFEPVATDLYKVSGPGFFLAALMIEERVKAWQAARQNS